MTNPLQEDKGLVKIHSVCTNMDAIWRPTPCHDLGIDGQIEFLETGTSISTGHILAIQSKSGPSYFENQDDSCVKYYPKEKHRKYWQRIRLPVFLVLHNPENDLTLYTRVKPQLGTSGPIVLDKSSLFSSAIRISLLDAASKDYEEFIDKSVINVLDGLKRIRLPRGDNKEISGIEFLLACTNRKQGYFELRMCRITSLFHLLSEESSIGIGSEDYDYVLRNVLQIEAQRIATDFLDDFDHWWYELSMVPDISVPLSAFGEEVVEYLYNNISEYINPENFQHLKYSSVLSIAELISSNAQKSSDRLDASDRLPEVLR